MPWTSPETFTAGQTLTAASMNAISGNLTALINVKSTALTAASSISLATATTSADISGLTVAITPSASTSKVLVMCALTLDCDIAINLHALLYRDGAATAGVGDAASSRVRATAGLRPAASQGHTFPFTYLDSPATTSAVTYSVRLRHGSGGTRTIYINRGTLDTDAGTEARYISTITAMEIPA